MLDGANVHVSMVGFDDGEDRSRILDSVSVATINSNLSATSDISQARVLAANARIGFMGDTKGGSFDIDAESAIAMLKSPNPDGSCNSDMVVPWTNGMDVTRRPRDLWIIDYPLGMSMESASRHETPFSYVLEKVKPARTSSRSSVRDWWIHERPRVEMREAIGQGTRFVATLTVSKHRLFVWMTAPTVPDHQLIAFARADDYFFGIVHSRAHEVWALKLGTRLETRPRYTPTTCFETFPFPEPTDAQREAISAAAKELDELRQRWLSPPEWVRTEVLEFPGTVGGPWDRYIAWSGDRGQATGKVGTVKYPRLVPKDEEAARALKKRTLTNLYNERPTWLDLAHRKLDEAVFAAYGWDPAISDDELLAKLLALNLERAGAQ